MAAFSKQPLMMPHRQKGTTQAFPGLNGDGAYSCWLSQAAAARTCGHEDPGVARAELRDRGLACGHALVRGNAVRTHAIRQQLPARG